MHKWKNNIKLKATKKSLGIRKAFKKNVWMLIGIVVADSLTIVISLKHIQF